MTIPGTRQRRILVVDDEPLVCESIKWLLALDGDEVETAVSGQQALTLFREGWFDAVVIDYEMPGMHGTELAAAIKKLDPRQPVLLITAYPETLVALKTPVAGVDLVIGKPFSHEQLRQALTNTIAKSQILPPAALGPATARDQPTRGTG
ncbi:MAG TPA: response regulator [Verrucomicrobiae bacterium]